MSTMVVNVLGGFLLGAMIAFMVLVLPNKGRDLHLLLAVGLLGGFTTFSAFSLDALALWQRGQTGAAALYVLTTVLVSLVAVAGGFMLGRSA